MKRALVIFTVMTALLLTGLATAAPSQANVPRAKQIAKMLKCGKFKSTRPPNSKPRKRTSGTCQLRGVVYEIDDYASSSKAWAVLYLIDVFAGALNTPVVVGSGATWLVYTKEGAGLPHPMRKAVKRIGGKVKLYGKKK